MTAFSRSTIWRSLTLFNRVSASKPATDSSKSNFGATLKLLNPGRLLRAPGPSRARLLIALGKRLRFGTQAKIICALTLFLVAFSVRALVAADLAPVTQTSAQPPFRVMSLGFHYEALGIIKGEGLLIRKGWDPTNTSLLIHAPGYAIFIAAIYKLAGKDYFTVQFVQDLVNSLAPVLVFLIAGRLLTWPIGIVSGLIVAVWHHFAYFSNVVLPDGMCALPMLAAVLTLTERGKQRAWWAYALAGTLLGLSVWIKPNTLMLGVFVALAYPLISTRRRPIARRSWLIAVTSLLVVAPITIRNYVLYREFIPISINSGIVMWEGIADAGGQHFGAVKLDTEVAAQEAIIYNDPRYAEMWRWPDGIRRDRDRLRRSLGVIIRNPFWFARAMIWRVGEMFKYSADAPLVFRNTDAGYKAAGEQARQTDKRKKNDPPAPPPMDELSGIPIVSYGESISWARPVVRLLQRSSKETALPFIMIGLLMVLFISPRRGLYILLVPFYYFVFQSTLHTEFRYTLPLHHFMFMFAAATWVAIGATTWRILKRLVGRKSRQRQSATAA